MSNPMPIAFNFNFATLPPGGYVTFHVTNQRDDLVVIDEISLMTRLENGFVKRIQFPWPAPRLSLLARIWRWLARAFGSRRAYHDGLSGLRVVSITLGNEEIAFGSAPAEVLSLDVDVLFALAPGQRLELTLRNDSDTDKIVGGAAGGMVGHYNAPHGGFYAGTVFGN